jgi:hypothetical protein
VSESVVFDTSAFIDLVEVKQTAYTYRRRADRGALQLVFPATAMARGEHRAACHVQRVVAPVVAG